MANVNSVPQGLFGPGILWVTRNDIANQTPTNIGYVNEFSMDVTFSTKELYGQNQFALLVARGTAKCTGKMKAATLSGAALNAVLIGQSWTSGTQYDAFTSTASAIPTGVSPAITPTVPSSGTWNRTSASSMRRRLSRFHSSAPRPASRMLPANIPIRRPRRENTNSPRPITSKAVRF